MWGVCAVRQSVHPDVMTTVKTPFSLETQGPCGNVRTCDVDTVTDDTSAQVKDVTPVTLGATFAGKKTYRGLRDSEPVEGESIRSITSGTRQLHWNEIGLSEHCEHG